MDDEVDTLVHLLMEGALPLQPLYVHDNKLHTTNGPPAKTTINSIGETSKLNGFSAKAILKTGLQKDAAEMELATIKLLGEKLQRVDNIAGVVDLLWPDVVTDCYGQHHLILQRLSGPRLDQAQLTKDPSEAYNALLQAMRHTAVAHAVVTPKANFQEPVRDLEKYLTKLGQTTAAQGLPMLDNLDKQYALLRTIAGYFSDEPVVYRREPTPMNFVYATNDESRLIGIDFESQQGGCCRQFELAKLINHQRGLPDSELGWELRHQLVADYLETIGDHAGPIDVDRFAASVWLATPLRALGYAVTVLGRTHDEPESIQLGHAFVENTRASTRWLLEHKTKLPPACLASVAQISPLLDYLDSALASKEERMVEVYDA